LPGFFPRAEKIAAAPRRREVPGGPPSFFRPEGVGGSVDGWKASAARPPPVSQKLGPGREIALRSLRFFKSYATPSSPPFTRCTVDVPTPTCAATFRMPIPEASPARIAASASSGTRGRAEHLEQSLAGRRAGVEPLLVQIEVDVFGMHLVEERDQ